MANSKILQKLIEHDDNFHSIDKRFDGYDQKFESIDRRFDAHDKKFNSIENRLDLHTLKFLEHDDRLQRIEETMATKNDISIILIALDQIAKSTNETNNEVKIIGHRTQRMEIWIEKAAVKIQIPYER